MDELQTQTPSIEDQELAYTRSLRRKFIGTLTNNGVDFPTDPEAIEAFTKLLADVDKQALSLKKLKLQQEVNQQNGDAAALVAQMLVKITGLKMQNVADQSIDAPELPETVGETVVTEGLTDKDPGSETFAEFSARMGTE